MRKFLTSLTIVIICILLITVAYSYYTHNSELEAMKALYKRDVEIPHPLINPYSEAKYKLGKALFFDPRLSDTDAISCATCHNPAIAWMDGLPGAKGKGHQTVARRTMALYNLAWDDTSILWDNRAKSLEDQVLEALTAPMGMSMSIGDVIQKIESIEGYKSMFKEAFEKEDKKFAANNHVNINSIAAAIATFERTIVSGMAPFDRWIDGEEDAISEEAKNGFILFNTKARCADCHSSWRFSDANFYNIGIDDNDLGFALPRDKRTWGRFKAVGLRNIELRSPYMHNGSLKTLYEVIDFYNRGGDKRRESTAILPIGLTEKEKQDLVAFLLTLTDEGSNVVIPALPH